VNDKMCQYHDEKRGVPVEDRSGTGHAVYPCADVKSLRKRRVKCPECGRRMSGWVAVGYDDELRLVVPPHKRKKWWKRNGK